MLPSSQLAALVLSLSILGSHAQLVVNLQTPPVEDGKFAAVFAPSNTDPSSQFGTSLLGAGTAGALYGWVPTETITSACKQVVAGAHTISMTIHAPSNGPWSQGTTSAKLKLVATGGCESGENEAGTQFVFTVDGSNPAGKLAVVCSTDQKFLSSHGCSVWVTSNDISSLYSAISANATHSGRRLQKAGCGLGLLGGGASSLVIALGVITACASVPVVREICIIQGAAAVVGTTAGATAATALIGCIIGATVDTPKTSCFPGDAEVLLENGSRSFMRDLRLGAKVAATQHDGSVSFEAVYARGHQDDTGTESYIRLDASPLDTVASVRRIELSAKHFIPTWSGVHVYHYKRAEAVKIGDHIKALGDNGTALMYHVTDIASIFKQGLFNPLTMSGNILVNNVHVSVHSDWFLDSALDAVGLTHWLADVYQVILLPIRMLYTVLGHDTYLMAYKLVESHLGPVDKVGSDYYLSIAAFSIAASSVMGVLVVKGAKRK